MRFSRDGSETSELLGKGDFMHESQGGQSLTHSLISTGLCETRVQVSGKNVLHSAAHWETEGGREAEFRQHANQRLFSHFVPFKTLPPMVD